VVVAVEALAKAVAKAVAAEDAVAASAWMPKLRSVAGGAKQGA